MARDEDNGSRYRVHTPRASRDEGSNETNGDVKWRNGLINGHGTGRMRIRTRES